MNRARLDIVLIARLAVSGHAAQQPGRYPPHWGAPAPAEGAPGREILPQAAQARRGHSVEPQRES
jgi:hypothetical protein